jgi:hypothetical protein
LECRLENNGVRNNGKESDDRKGFEKAKIQHEKGQ